MNRDTGEKLKLKTIRFSQKFQNYSELNPKRLSKTPFSYIPRTDMS